MEQPPDYTQEGAQRGLGLQCAIAVSIGGLSMLGFSVWRRRWPRMFAARSFRRQELPSLDDGSLFGWMYILHKTTDRQVLEWAGLDAFVYLKFFQAAMVLFTRLGLVSFLIIGPLRWWFLGHYDDDGPIRRNVVFADKKKKESDEPTSLFGDFVGVYFVFTYVFTVIVFRVMRKFTNEVVAVRQEYLGHQNSITDRTLRINGVPRALWSPEKISQYLTRLFRVGPSAVTMCRDWSRLDELSKEREKVIRKLERLWASYVGPGWSGPGPNGEMPPLSRRPQGRPTFRSPKVDLIDWWTVKLASLDAQVKAERSHAAEQPTAATAFATMKSVADCQLAAQALLSPKPHELVATLAPAPHDVVWRNIYVPTRRRSIQNYAVTLVVAISGASLVVPVSYLARLLKLDTVAEFSPRLADWLRDHPWSAALFTEVLPTFVYAGFNFVVPYFYAFLSERQGYVSREDVELSTVTKNFFYVFVNLFLVFTISSTYLLTTVVDTTKIARGFADSLLNLSTFYTNLIVLQGIGLTPARLLQAGSVVQLPWVAAHCRSARDYHELYRPATLTYGILLPTPLLIFIVVLVYSIIRKRIVFFGLIYFVVGYYVAKYQFLYSMVHPQHSNGRLWTLILRRVYLGVFVFQLAMIGILVLQTQYTLAALLIPALGALAAVWYDFEHFTEPLLRFIAIGALHSPPKFSDDVGSDADEVEEETETETDHSHSSRSADRESVEQESAVDVASDVEAQLPHLRHRPSRTLDEDRELHQRYVNQNTVMSLDGPWVGTDDGQAIIATGEGFVRRQISYEGWS